MLGKVFKLLLGYCSPSWRKSRDPISLPVEGGPLIRGRGLPGPRVGDRGPGATGPPTTVFSWVGFVRAVRSRRVHECVSLGRLASMNKSALRLR